MEREPSAMDRISELPDFIIQHIISFLDYKEAARTMVLSKPWLSAWSTRQFLDFDQTYFSQIKTDPDTILTLIDNTLQNHSHQRISIQKFRLHTQSIEDSKFLPYIEKWLPMVLQNNPVELDFNTKTWKSSIFPPQIFGSKSLQVLTAVYQPLGASLILRNTDIICRNLKNLRLFGVRMDDATFRNLIRRCSLIEEIILAGFGEFDVHIANLPYLRVLGLIHYGDHDLNINIDDVPKLQLLTCMYMTVVNIGESGKLRDLSLVRSSIVDEQLNNILSKNKFLKELSLKGCSKLTLLNYSSRSLKCLTIKNCLKLEEGVIDAPKLSMFKYYNRGGKLVRITSPRPVRKARVWVRCPEEVDASWFYDLRDFLAVFKKSKVEINSTRSIRFNSEGFRAYPVPREVEMLKVNYKHPVCIEHLEGLISICHPKTVLCDYPDTTSDEECVRNFCKKLKSRKIPKCCNSDDEIKCWRHYLRDAQLYIWDDNGKKPLRLNKFSLSRFFKANKFNVFSNVRVCFNLEWKYITCNRHLNECNSSII